MQLREHETNWDLYAIFIQAYIQSTDHLRRMTVTLGVVNSGKVNARITS